MYKQIIIVRRDLNMSPGKIAAQVSHASMAFLTNAIRENTCKVIHPHGNEPYYETILHLPVEMYNEWIEGSFTKIVCGARNKNRLLKAINTAKELTIPCFPIYDNCRTELKPEEEDGTTLTCVGFPPLDDKITSEITKGFHLL